MYTQPTKKEDNFKLVAAFVSIHPLKSFADDLGGFFFGEK